MFLSRDFIERGNTMSRVASRSAGAYPFPFSVLICMKIGPLRSLTCLKSCTSLIILWPLIGPKYLNPKDSKSMPGVKTALMPRSMFRATDLSRSPKESNLPVSPRHLP